MSQDLVRGKALASGADGMPEMSLRDKIAHVLVNSIDADWLDEVDREGARIIANKIMAVILEAIAHDRADRSMPTCQVVHIGCERTCEP